MAFRPDYTADPFYLSILNSITDTMIVIKKDFTVDYANQSVQCDSVDEAVGQKCYALLHGRTTPCEDCPCTDVFKTGKQSRSIRRSGHQGEALQKELRVYPILDVDGQVARAIEIVQDLPFYTDSSPVALPASPGEKTAFFGMIGQSKKMRALFHMTCLVAPSNATVLICGESGTGKERVAQAIHQLSPRRQGPFVAIDCGALPETLLESELFGHVKGAFTGAFQNKKGLFEEAKGGTLFLDEIGDTSLVFQSKLLRALQEGETRPVGGNRSVKIDVRLIAATNRSLKEAIAKKTFREDLYYRLAVMPILIPPLRGRLDDIRLLCDYFIKKYTQQNGKGPMTLSKEAFEVLLRMPWKGNVRELENIIERGVLVSQQSEILLESLLIDEEVTSFAPPIFGSLLSGTKEVRTRVERERIIDSLEQHNGNKSRAARALGISRASLYNKLKQYQISSAA